MRHRVTVTAFCLALTGCQTVAPIAPRAAVDLRCSESDLTIREIDGSTRVVDGCGKRAVYVKVCNHLIAEMSECTWAMNTIEDGGSEKQVTPIK
jgi:hypothetical protein